MRRFPTGIWTVMGKDRLLPNGVSQRKAFQVALALAGSTFAPSAWSGAAALAGSPATTGVAPLQSPGLSVVSGGTMEMGAPNVARQDLGVVDGTMHPVLQAVFVLRNTGQAPVTITNLQ